MKILKRGRGFNKKVFLKSLKRVRNDILNHEDTEYVTRLRLWLNDCRTTSYMKRMKIKIKGKLC